MIIERCKKCTLPTTYPGIEFDADGVCDECQDFDIEKDISDKKKSEMKLAETIEQIREENQAMSYDCIVALSGGKDSCFTLKKLTENYKLRCLAITVDNGFLSDQAIINSRLICDELGVDYILYRLPVKQIKKLYIDSLESRQNNQGAISRASDLCNSCINLINKIMIKEAVNRKIFSIAGGYIAGQVPKGTCVLPLSIKWLLEMAKQQPLGEFSRIAITESDIEGVDVNRFLKILNPMLATTYDQSEVVAELQKIGWVQPDDTGVHSSNCQINDLGIMNHIKKYGFHPYEAEIAEQVRAGTLSREAAIGKLESPINEERVNGILARLQ